MEDIKLEEEQKSSMRMTKNITISFFKICIILLLLTIGMLLTSCYSSMTNFDGDVIQVLIEDEWSWASNSEPCSAEKQTIEVNENKSLMTMKWKDKEGNATDQVYQYVIQEISNSQLEVDLIGEKRKTREGKLVSWDLIIKSPKLYCWHRTDWPKFQCTVDMYKCKNQQN